MEPIERVVIFLAVAVLLGFAATVAHGLKRSPAAGATGPTVSGGCDPGLNGATNISDEEDCPLRGGALSFYEGCLVYVEDPDRDADQDDDGDDID